MGKLAGKTAVVTGGSSGIGLATAQRFVNEGAYVFITGRRQTELDAAANQIGANLTATQGDISNLADLDRLYATVSSRKAVSTFSSPTQVSENLLRSPPLPKSSLTRHSPPTSRAPCSRFRRSSLLCPSDRRLSSTLRSHP